MKYITSAVVIATAALLAACAGNSGKKSTESSARQAPVQPAQTRCPPGTLQDQQGNCVEEQSRRRGPLRDTLGRSIDDLSFPQPALPSDGLLRR